jgi:subtilase family serine protease
VNNQQGSWGSQGAGPAQENDPIARELSSLKQALDHLAAVERDLENRRVQLQSQIAYYTGQAQQAYQAEHYDRAYEAQAKLATLQSELARVQEQMGRVVARQREITTRQFELLRQTSIGQASFPPPRKPRKRRRVLIGLSAAVLLIALVGLGLAEVLRSLPLHLPTSVTQTQPSPGSTTTPFPTPTPTPQILPFTPDGTGPTTQQCERAVGGPCYSPEQIQKAFNLTGLYQRGFDGAGQTIVILGAGNTAFLQADLHHFDQTWGLPDPPSFKIIQQNGPPTPYTCPDKVDDLQIENTLDVEWAHAIAPGANIVLVIGSNNAQSGSQQDNCYFVDLESTLNNVLYNPLGQVVTISYGGSDLGAAGETPSERAAEIADLQQEDEVLQQAASNGITVLAATGDNGATNPDGSNNGNGFWKQPNVGWPASDPYVLAVGGTTLQIQDASGTYGSETVWNDGRSGGATGGGLSSIFPEPGYQQNLPNQAMFQGKRGIPDVSFPAEPSYDIYGSFEQGIMGQVNPSRWKGWDIIGGTSISSPCWAGLIAIANQMRGKPFGLLQPALYRVHGKGMHDITVGNNSYAGVTGYSAQPGYDLATGWGTPIADQLLPNLIEAVDQPLGPCSGYWSPCN